MILSFYAQLNPGYLFLSAAALVPGQPASYADCRHDHDPYKNIYHGRIPPFLL